MRNKHPPKIEKAKVKSEGYTKISWKLDFNYINEKEYTDDMISLFYKYCYDAAFAASKYKVEVFLNDEVIKIDSLEDYALSYKIDNSEEIDTDEVASFSSKDSEVVLVPCKAGGFKHISFVNNGYTPLGGLHVDVWSEAIFRPLVRKFNGEDVDEEKAKEKKKAIKKEGKKKPVKKSKVKLNINDINQFFCLFISSTIDKPEYNGQAKTYLKGPKNSINTIVPISKTRKILKWSFKQDVENLIKVKEYALVKKSESGSGGKKIPGYDKANYAGTDKSQECTLIITEGLSAKGFAVRGIESGLFGKKGRDFNGIIPIKGKCLNVRKATITQITENKEVNSIKKALKLKQELDYSKKENRIKMSYGKLCLCTDADDDGTHIAGLITNFIHYFYPGLLMNSLDFDNFLWILRTPIVRVYLKAEILLFYKYIEAKKFMENEDLYFKLTKGAKKPKIKYSKGLGTSNKSETKAIFGTRVAKLIYDEKASDSLKLAFDKDSVVRKSWIINHSEKIPNEDMKEEDIEFVRQIKPKNNKIIRVEPYIEEVFISDFVNNDVVQFSWENCKRTLPSIVDGLKEVQRKALFAFFLKKLNYTSTEIKTKQIASYISEKTDYHYGEDNISDTVSRMAQEFQGTNNIPLFAREGDFGSRLLGPSIFSDPRYTFTKLDELTRLIFRQEDDAVLEYLESDGKKVEPKFYVPIIPMILVNSSSGIGTGFSTSIPNYNPEDLIEWIKTWLKEDGNVMEEIDGNVFLKTKELVPWYRGFIGTIDREPWSLNYNSTGIIKEISKGKYEITEIPIGVWTDNFKEKLESLQEKGKIKKIDNYSKPNQPKFIVKSDVKPAIKMSSRLNTTNMVLFNGNGKITKYHTVEHIINEYCKIRFEFYKKRKENQMKEFKDELLLLKNKIRFLTEFLIEKTLNIQEFNDDELLIELQKRKYDLIFSKKKLKKDEDEDEDEDKKENHLSKGYKYILTMNTRTMTKNKLKELKDKETKVVKTIEELMVISQKEMWLSELEEFLVKYKAWVIAVEQEDES